MTTITDLAETTRILSGWSREVELTVDGTTRWPCSTCSTTVMVTAGKPDRVRCLKCKTLFMVEL